MRSNSVAIFTAPHRGMSGRLRHGGNLRSERLARPTPSSGLARVAGIQFGRRDRLGPHQGRTSRARRPSTTNRFPSIVGTTIDGSIRLATKMVCGGPEIHWYPSPPYVARHGASAARGYRAASAVRQVGLSWPW